jgi:Uma2 family endonuclease
MAGVTSAVSSQDETDQRVSMHDVSWEVYESLLAARGDGAVPRLSYLDGELELMSPSRFHERIKETLATLFVLHCSTRRITIQACGSWTVRRRNTKAGAEPDASYVFGRAEPVRPDLAIEVVWTSGGLEKLEVYRRLDVPEVWLWKGGSIGVSVLRGGTYVAQRASAVLPDFDLVLACNLAQLDSISDAVALWQQALQP